MLICYQGESKQGLFDAGQEVSRQTCGVRIVETFRSDCDAIKNAWNPSVVLNAYGFSGHSSAGEKQSFTPVSTNDLPAIY